MKRISLTVAILFAASVAVFAQQAGTERPTSAQTRDEATRLLDQTRTNSSQFESTFDDLSARNTGNTDSATYSQLKAEIARLENLINTDQSRIRASLDAGTRVSPELFQRVRRLMNQHRQKMAELEAFTTTTGTSGRQDK
jgi:hypothetical protein